MSVRVVPPEIERHRGFAALHVHRGVRGKEEARKAGEIGAALHVEAPRGLLPGRRIGGRVRQRQRVRLRLEGRRVVERSAQRGVDAASVEDGVEVRRRVLQRADRELLGFEGGGARRPLRGDPELHVGVHRAGADAGRIEAGQPGGAVHVEAAGVEADERLGALPVDCGVRGLAEAFDRRALDGDAALADRHALGARGHGRSGLDHRDAGAPEDHAPAGDGERGVGLDARAAVLGVRHDADHRRVDRAAELHAGGRELVVLVADVARGDGGVDDGPRERAGHGPRRAEAFDGGSGARGRSRRQ